MNQEGFNVLHALPGSLAVGHGDDAATDSQRVPWRVFNEISVAVCMVRLRQPDGDALRVGMANVERFIGLCRIARQHMIELGTAGVIAPGVRRCV